MEPDGTPAIPPVSGAPKQSGVVYTPPENPGQYIRTYAKDVASLTNTEAPQPTIEKKAPESPPKTDSTALGKSTDMGVTVDERDASPVNRADGASPKQFEQEVVALSKEDSEGVFANAQKPAPVSGMAPSQPIAPTQQVESGEADRAAILARLRAKLARQSQTSTEQPAPLPKPAPAPVIEVPVTEPEPAPVPPPPPPAPEPLPVQKPVIEAAPPRPVPPPPPVRPASEAPAPMHTFSSDFADRIDTRGASTFSVLAAQSDAGQTVSSAPSRRTTIVPLIAGLVLVVGGIGLAAGAFIFGNRASDVPYVSGVPSLIRFDESVEVSGEGVRLADEINAVANGGVVNANAIVTYVTAQQEGEEGLLSTPAPGGVLIAALGLPAPAILLRNIDRSSTVGVINAGGETRPFFVLKANSYERTFAGMLTWEATMARDLAAFYPQNTSVLLPNQTATSSTSTPTVAAPTPMPFFVDAVVANYDVRALRDSNGNTILIYGYYGRDILIIARNDAAFTALVNRIIPSTGE